MTNRIERLASFCGVVLLRGAGYVEKPSPEVERPRGDEEKLPEDRQ